MKLDEMKDSINSLWNSLSEGWQQLVQSASTALTRFRPGGASNLPSRHEVDDMGYFPSLGWALLGGDVFEDDDRLVVRLEVPGMEKKDFDIRLVDDMLVVTGEKRFQRESTEGRWQVLQCAYGSFRRQIPLSTKVLLDEAKATYLNAYHYAQLI